MNISQVTLGNLTTGPLSGLVVFELVPGEAKVKTAKLIKILEDAGKEQHTSAIALTERLTPDKDLGDLVKVLREKHWFVYVECSGDYFPNWIERASYRVVIRTDDEPWLGFDCNEIVFAPSETLKEPFIADNHLQNGTILSIYGLPKIAQRDLFFFLQESVYRWRLEGPSKHFTKHVWSAK